MKTESLDELNIRKSPRSEYAYRFNKCLLKYLQIAYLLIKSLH